VEVGAAEADGLRPDDDLARPGLARLGHVDDLHLPPALYDRRAHGGIESRRAARRNESWSAAPGERLDRRAARC
jgi:hypothetical protein